MEVEENLRLGIGSPSPACACGRGSVAPSALQPQLLIFGTEGDVPATRRDAGKHSLGTAIV
jgi:hypothetical protein